MLFVVLFFRRNRVCFSILCHGLSICANSLIHGFANAVETSSPLKLDLLQF